MANYADPGAVAVQPSKLQPGALLVLIAGLVAVGFAAFSFLQTASVQANVKDLDNRISQEDQRLAQLAPVSQKLAEYDNLATVLTKHFSEQRRWGSVLAAVESRLYKKMRVTSLQVTDKGELTFSGITSDFNEYAKVYASLITEQSQEFITNVQVLSVGRADNAASGEVSFSFQTNLTNKALLAGAALK